MNMNMNGGRMFGDTASARNNTDDKFEEANEIFQKVRGAVFSNFFIKMKCLGII